MVSISGAIGCTRTLGCWSTHSINGPAPYDATWDAKDGGNAPFLATGSSYYEILNTPAKWGNAYLILAYQYIAAELNMVAGASAPQEVTDAMAEALSLLKKYEDAVDILKKINKKPFNPDRFSAIGLAGLLNFYHNGVIGPGHCQ